MILLAQLLTSNGAVIACLSNSVSALPFFAGQNKSFAWSDRMRVQTRGEIDVRLFQMDYI